MVSWVPARQLPRRKGGGGRPERSERDEGENGRGARSCPAASSPAPKWGASATKARTGGAPAPVLLRRPQLPNGVRPLQSFFVVPSPLVSFAPHPRFGAPAPVLFRRPQPARFAPLHSTPSLRSLARSHAPHGAPVVGSRDGSEPLLPGSVPHLQLDLLVVHGDVLDLEVDADGRDVGRREGGVGEAQEEARLAHAGVADEQQLHQVVILLPRGSRGGHGKGSGGGEGGRIGSGGGGGGGWGGRRSRRGREGAGVRYFGRYFGQVEVQAGIR
jgi:hypothetical protein